VAGVSITLDATVSDDGLPGGTLSYTWSKASGPGNVSFGSPGQVDTTATFSAAGSYVLRLDASDGMLSAGDNVSVSVSAANQPPQVDAGADRTAVAGVSITLDATVSDDGLPGGTLSYGWSKVSGPGKVSFGSPGQVDTTATFSAAGSYLLRLDASDGTLSAGDEVMVSVAGAASSEKKAASSTDPGLLILSLALIALRYRIKMRL
jgi:hypothetical protein